MKVSLFSSLAVSCLARADQLEQRQSNWTVGQTVQTSSGPVNGQAASNATAVSTYLGIPFAVPPVGDLRFAAPQKYSGNSTVNGTAFVCPHSKKGEILTRNTGILMRSSHILNRQCHPSRTCKGEYHSSRTPSSRSSGSNRR